MRGNQLFGIFSPEKLKKVIPSGSGAQMRGNQLFGIFSPEKLKFSAFSAMKSSKSDSPAPGSRSAGRSPDARKSAFRHFQP